MSVSGSSANRRVWQLSVVMTAIAVAAAVPRLDHDWQLPTTAPWALVVLVPAFALAEIVVIHLPAQRSSHSHTFREMPAIVGLTFLATQEYLAACVVGGALGLLLWTRQRGLKLVFNLSMFALEASLGSASYELVMGSSTDVIAPRAWGAALLAVLVTDLISAAAVTAAISLTEGSFDHDVLKEALRYGLLAAVVNTCVALLVVTLIIARPSALPLLGAVVVLLVLGFRTYVTVARGYARTQQLYEFVEATGRTAELEDAVPAILRETAKLLRAEQVQMVVSMDQAESIHTVFWQDGLFGEAVMDWPSAGRLWWGPALSGHSVLLAQDQARERADGGPRDGIAVAMREDAEVIGVLHVADRSFDEETFGPDDLRLFEALAAHATVALSNARSIERLKVVAEERRHEALHDPLTSLSNRRAFTEVMEHAMAGSEGGAVLLLDLDDFKDVNDTLGHTAGDALLRVTGARLEAETTGTVARLGGDEFAVLLPGASVVEATATAHRLRAAIMRPVPMSDVELSTSASIGVAELSRSASTSDDVLAQADVAMYAAKEAKTGVETYRAEDGDAIGRRLVLAADMAKALPQRELELWFQPQADLADGRITGFEALVRWHHPQFGWVPPPEIVAVAQRTGLVRSLTDFVVGEALRHRSAWAQAGFDVEVAVNVTPRDIADLTLVKRVTHALETTATPASSLVVEVTESDALGDPERAIGVLSALSEAGVRLSVDDFGTGYSSLAYLERLPVDEVKIDQSFVFRLERNPEDSTIMRATVALAHDLGLRVIAEGVESDACRGLVAGLGCDVYQGYGLSKALPGDQVVGWLERTAGAPAPSLTLLRPARPGLEADSAAV